MIEPDIGTLMFFDKYSNAVPIYLRFEETICSVFTDVNKRVLQITLHTAMRQLSSRKRGTQCKTNWHDEKNRQHIP